MPRHGPPPTAPARITVGGRWGAAFGITHPTVGQRVTPRSERPLGEAGFNGMNFDSGRKPLGILRVVAERLAEANG